MLLGAASGGAAVWFGKPLIAPDPRIAVAEKRASDADTAAAAQKRRADALETSLDAAAKARRDAEAKLSVAEVAQKELAGKAAADLGVRKESEAVLAKLKATRAGAVRIDGSEVHLQISSAALFRPNDDALTDRGKAVLAKVSAVLKELPDRQVWVQGHTDDQPVPLPKAPPVKKGARPVAAAPAARFPTNWELSAARAVAVVHYLQDVAKLDPVRLAALAFSQYAPASKKDKAANRRIEIVVAGKKAS